MFSGKVESQYLVGSSSHPNRMLTLLGKAGIVGHSISSHSSGRGVVEIFLCFVSFARVTAARSVASGTDPHQSDHQKARTYGHQKPRSRSPALSAISTTKLEEPK
jgi:hypothetical protein